MRIVEVKATDKIEEAWELLNTHRDELATHKHLMVLKPDISRYKMLEDRGSLLTLVVYDGDTIIGYSVTVISQNLHYVDLVYAMNDILFIHPRFRGSMWGMKLIHETEKKAYERGAKLMIFHGKKDTAFSSLMPRLGYQVQDILFSKEL